MATRAQTLQIAAYAGFFVFSFTLFAYWTFPYERVVDGYLQRFAAERGYRIELEDVDPHWLTGVEVENLHLYTSDEDEVGIRLLEAHARAGLWSLLSDGTDISFSAEFATGSLEGSYEQDEETMRISAELDNVRLEMLPMLADAIGLPIAGAATGEIDLLLASEPDKSEGTVDLSIEKLRLGDGTAKLSIPGVPSFTVDPIEAGTLTMKLVVAQGKADLKELKSDGKDVQLEGSGEVRLGKSLATSRPSIALRARFTDAYKKKTPRTEAMFSLLESSSSRQLKRAMSADGWLAFDMSGSLVAPRFVPGGGGSGPSRPALGGRRSPRRPAQRARPARRPGK